MKKLSIIAIVGSLRENSYNRQLAKAAEAVVADSAEFEILDYSDLPFMNQDIEFPAPEAVARVRARVKEADGVWFFTPEYNHFFPGVLKNLIDWLSRPQSREEPQPLAGKPVAISGISPGMAGTALAQDHLVTLLSFLDARIMNVPRLTIPNAGEQLDDNDKLALKSSARYLERQADTFLRFLADGK
jgi:chromate reductase